MQFTSMSTFGKMDLISTNNANNIDVDYWENGFNQHKQYKLLRCRIFESGFYLVIIGLNEL
jgi:hypothetical protein